MLPRHALFVQCRVMEDDSAGLWELRSIVRDGAIAHFLAFVWTLGGHAPRMAPHEYPMMVLGMVHNGPTENNNKRVNEGITVDVWIEG